MSNYKKHHSRKFKNRSKQRKKYTKENYPLKKYKITFVSYNDPRIKKILDKKSYQDYFNKKYNDNFDE